MTRRSAACAAAATAITAATAIRRSAMRVVIPRALFLQIGGYHYRPPSTPMTADTKKKAAEVCFNPGRHLFFRRISPSTPDTQPDSRMTSRT